MATRNTYHTFPENSYYAGSGEGRNRIYRGYAILFIPARPANIHHYREPAAYEVRSLTEHNTPHLSQDSTIPAFRFRSRKKAADYIDHHLSS